MSKQAGMLLAAFFLVANGATSAQTRPPASCKGALANPEVYEAVREAAQITVDRLQERDVSYRDIFHELHNDLLSITRNNPVVQNNINKLRSELFDEFAKEKTSPFGRQINACFPMLPKLVQTTKERQAQRKEEQQKHGDPSCERALAHELFYGADIGLEPESARELAAFITNPKMEALAKKIAADVLENDPINNGDVADPSSGFDRRVEKFKSGIATGVKSGGHHISNMTSRQMLSCFPDLVAMKRTYEADVEAAEQEQLKRQEEEAQRQQKEAERAKLPVNVLGNAYAAYIDVKRCYEAREGYSMIYISDPEMERAKNAVQEIEEAVKPKLDPNTAEHLWSRVQEFEGRSFNPSGDYLERTRALCRERLGLLLQALREQVPESRRIEKDF